MNENKMEATPMKTRKFWVEPTVTVIDLNAARHGNLSTISDAGANHRS